MTQPTKSQINRVLEEFEFPPIDYTLDSSLPDVMRVAERLRKKKHIITIGSSKKEGCNWYCMIEKSWTGTCYWGEADTYAEAIARACYEVLKEVE